MDSLLNTTVKFDFMLEDTVLTSVTWDRKSSKIGFINFTDNTALKAFGNKHDVTESNLYDFFEYRCFPKSRSNCKEILEGLGIHFYEPYLIISKTYGVLSSDRFWVRFESDTRKYEEVRNSVYLP